MSLLENRPDLSDKSALISLPRKQKAKWPVVIGSVILAMGAVSVTGRIIIASTMLSVGQLPIIPFLGALVDVLPIATGVLLIRRQPAGWTLFKVVVWLNLPLLPFVIFIYVSCWKTADGLIRLIIIYSGICLCFFVVTALWMSGRKHRRALNGW